MRKLLLVATLGSTSFLFSQAVCKGTEQQCVEAQRRVCASEPTPVNLQLSRKRIVKGTVADRSGASFTGVVVQLRLPVTDAIFRSTAAEDGTFNLGEVRAGSYRLIVVKPGKNEIERIKMADQPKSLTCANSALDCALSIILTFHGTDNTIDFCPPK